MINHDGLIVCTYWKLSIISLVTTRGNEGRVIDKTNQVIIWQAFVYDPIRRRNYFSKMSSWLTVVFMLYGSMHIS